VRQVPFLDKVDDEPPRGGRTAGRSPREIERMRFAEVNIRG